MSSNTNKRNLQSSALMMIIKKLRSMQTSSLAQTHHENHPILLNINVNILYLLVFNRDEIKKSSCQKKKWHEVIDTAAFNMVLDIMEFHVDIFW